MGMGHVVSGSQSAQKIPKRTLRAVYINLSVLGFRSFMPHTPPYVQSVHDSYVPIEIGHTDAFAEMRDVKSFLGLVTKLQYNTSTRLYTQLYTGGGGQAIEV